jgi:threonine dehydrogenase-like Zn-dependent dehydrogenase
VLGEAEAVPAALEAAGREAEIDLAVETVGGSADTLRAAVAALKPLKPGGAVSVVGVFWGALALDPMPLLLKELTLAWSYCYGREAGHAADFETALGVLAAEQGALAPLVTHRARLDDVERAFAVAGDRRAGAIKVSVAP